MLLLLLSYLLFGGAFALVVSRDLRLYYSNDSVLYVAALCIMAMIWPLIVAAALFQLATEPRDSE